MEAMPCRDQRVGSAGLSPAAEPGMQAGGEGGPRQLRFADPGSGDSLSPDSSRCCCAGGNGCCAGDGGAETTTTLPDWPGSAAAQLKLLPMNDQIRELQTIIRDKTASRGDFVFSADRLIRLVVEEGLNRLPYTECTVTTPTGFRQAVSGKAGRRLQMTSRLNHLMTGIAIRRGCSHVLLCVMTLSFSDGVPGANYCC